MDAKLAAMMEKRRKAAEEAVSLCHRQLCVPAVRSPVVACHWKPFVPVGGARPRRAVPPTDTEPASRPTVANAAGTARTGNPCRSAGGSSRGGTPAIHSVTRTRSEVSSGRTVGTIAQVGVSSGNLLSAR